MEIVAINITENQVNGEKLSIAKKLNLSLGNLERPQVDYADLTQAEKDIWDAFVNLIKSKV